jgi:hypothetical protein
MTKLDRVIAAAKLIDAAHVAIARQRGVLARANNRPRSGILVPHFNTSAEHEAFAMGWDEADEHFS